jgi:hypothetical protein
MEPVETELSIEQMKGILGEESPATPQAQAIPANPEPEKPADKPVETQDDKPSAPGADKPQETQEPKEDKDKEAKPEDEPKGKFEKKAKSEESDAVQKRINKMTWEKHQAERQAEEAKREAAELKAKLEQQATGKPASEDKPSPEKPIVQFTGESAPVKPVQDSFETIEEYLDARDKYILDLQAYTQRKQTVDAKNQEISDKWNERVAEHAAVKPEISESLKNVGPWLDKAGQGNFIMTSDVGLEIVQYLHDHAEEALSLAKSGDPLVVARALGRIEAELVSKSKSNTAPKQKPALSSGSEYLPEPVAVVGGKATPSGGVDLSSDATSLSDWTREARRQLEAAG